MIEIIFGIVLLLIGFMIIVAITDAKYPFYIFSAYISMIIGAGILFTSKNQKPTALDVYQGKTTLEITYRNGIPVDTVVVFKSK